MKLYRKHHLKYITIVASLHVWKHLDVFHNKHLFNFHLPIQQIISLMQQWHNVRSREVWEEQDEELFTLNMLSDICS